MDDLQNIPAEPGSYALLLQLDHPRRLQIGQLGSAQLPGGSFLYLGSARGPGGLRARLKRHIHGQGPLHWHVDYLRHQARLIAVYVLAHEALPAERLECRWSQSLGLLPEAFWPVPGFGASDCQSGCRAHLVGFASIPASLPAALAWAAGVSPLRIITWQAE